VRFVHSVHASDCATLRTFVHFVRNVRFVHTAKMHSLDRGSTPLLPLNGLLCCNTGELISGEYGKFRIRSAVRLKTAGRGQPDGGCASPSRPRARSGPRRRRWRRASGRGREAGASSGRAARLLGLPPVRRATLAPFRAEWVAVLPRLRKALPSLAPRPASGSSCGEVATSARRRAGSSITASPKATALEPRLLSAAHCRAYRSGEGARGAAWWYDPRA